MIILAYIKFKNQNNDQGHLNVAFQSTNLLMQFFEVLICKTKS